MSQAWQHLGWPSGWGGPPTQKIDVWVGWAKHDSTWGGRHTRPIGCNCWNTMSPCCIESRLACMPLLCNKNNHYYLCTSSKYDPRGAITLLMYPEQSLMQQEHSYSWVQRRGGLVGGALNIPGSSGLSSFTMPIRSRVLTVVLLFAVVGSCKMLSARTRTTVAPRST